MRCAVWLLLIVASCKGDRVKCEQAARNYAELTYKKKMETELAALPESQRSLERKKKLAAYTNELENGIEFFVQQCVSANNDEQVDCMIAAKTAEEVAKCADPAGSD